jgi:predicted short-subunit dehydrogenase-like oxidoreductase (DUF2520 family)
MLPGMAGKPRVAIVGAGNFGTALAGSLLRAGYVIEAVIVRSGGVSLKKGQSLAKQVGARALSDLPIGPSVGGGALRADLIWFCVPDAESGRAARSLAGKIEWKGRVALHSSGVLTSDELAVLRRRGASVASVHPMMTFVRGSRPSLAAVAFAVEGDAAAVRMARRVIKDLGGHSYSIRKNDKAAYHAWGTFASPLFTALLATAEQVAALAGVNRREARRRMLPILQQTLANYAAFGAAGAFSGPIVRGDVDTVKRHLRVLRKVPIAGEIHLSLASAALAYLPGKNKRALMKELRSGRRKRRGE